VVLIAITVARRELAAVVLRGMPYEASGPTAIAGFRWGVDRFAVAGDP
jgi:hypothetical protein